MYNVEVFVDDDVLVAIEEQARRMPALVKGAVRLTANRIRKKIKKGLVQTTPPLPVLPFVWSLDPVKQNRARRWYFANKVPKGSRGGRYKRTGRMQAAWKIVTDINEKGVLIRLENDAPGVEYVMGFKQVPSHKRSGWPVADDIALKYSEVATEALIDMWYTIAEPEIRP